MFPVCTATTSCGVYTSRGTGYWGPPLRLGIPSENHPFDPDSRKGHSKCLNRFNATAITSNTNPRIKDLVRLRSRPHRDKAGLILIEGYRELSRALDAGIKPNALYYCPKTVLR